MCLLEGGRYVENRLLFLQLAVYVYWRRLGIHVIYILLLLPSFSQYPGLLSGMQINWNCDWSQSALLGEATYFVHKHALAKESPVQTR